MWYVYRHVRADKNLPFYIGIGQKKNFARAYNFSQRNKIWFDIQSKTEIEVEILFENLCKEEAEAKEKEFIALYGRLDLGTGTLANMTEGGEGSVGAVMPESRRQELSIRMSGSNNPMFNKRLTLEQEKKRVQAFKESNQEYSPQRKEKMSLSMMGNNYSCSWFMLFKEETNEILVFENASKCYQFLGTSKATFGYYVSGYRIKEGVKVVVPYCDRTFKGYKINRITNKRNNGRA